MIHAKKSIALLIAAALIFCLAACSVKSTEASLHCSLIVDCSAALASEVLSPEKAAALPENGLFLSAEDEAFREGETAYEILVRAMQALKLPFEASDAGTENAYMQGIGNLYEQDCGAMSGWLYTVNGKSPDVGAGRYAVQDGDEIRFYYVTDMSAEWN